MLLLSSHIILGSFSRLEEQSIRQNAQQTLRLLEDEMTKLESTLKDWSNWDDTYQFAVDGNRSYADNNLNDASLVNLNVNFMVFTNNAGHIVYEKAVDLQEEHDAALPAALRKHIKNSAILSRIEDESLASGIVLMPEGPVLIASAPILNSLEEGPARGRMIIGRYFDASQIKQMAEKLQLSLSLHRFDDRQLSHKLQDVVDAFHNGQQTVINKRDGDIIEIFFVIKDIYAEPILFMGIDRSRAIYVQGRHTLAYFTYFLIGMGAIFMLVTTALIEKVVLARLRSVSRQVKDIETKGDVKARVALSGRDELAQLATDLNKMLDALQHSTERDRNILDNIIDGYSETDLQGRILLTNRSLCRMSGFRETELLRMRIEDFIHPQDMAAMRQTIRNAIANDEPIRRLSGRFRTKAGQTGYFDAAINQVTDSEGRPTGYRSIIRDITELKQNEERLVYLAYHDPLTGLYNRKAFMERLDKEIAYAARYRQERTLLFIDLDKFKEVNDTFGHDAGDHLLGLVAKRIRSELRDTDVIARMGGDEFTILLTNPDHCSTGAVLERIGAALTQPFEIDGQTIDFISASIGAKQFPADAETTEELIKAADREMYRVKNQRKHTTICALIEQHQQRLTA